MHTARRYPALMPRPFLTAEWANLAIITFAVPPAMLAPFLPRDAGVQLDERTNLGPRGQAPGSTALVSLVAFQFLKTRVFGIPWPTLVNFPEINLRFYVRRGNLRGVMFLREIVPKAIITQVARRFYNEPYVTAPIAAAITRSPEQIRADYQLVWPCGKSPDGLSRHFLRVSARPLPVQVPDDSLEHWIKEHQWGFTPRPSSGAWAYEVAHPVWRTYPDAKASISLDFGVVYGPAWAFLSHQAPVSVVLAEGSPVAVYPRRDAASLANAP